jgi:hypothetical protein
MADTADLRSAMRKRVRVQVSPWAPILYGGRSSTWLEHLAVNQEVTGPNPADHPNFGGFLCRTQ